MIAVQPNEIEIESFGVQFLPGKCLELFFVEWAYYDHKEFARTYFDVDFVKDWIEKNDPELYKEYLDHQIDEDGIRLHMFNWEEFYSLEIGDRFALKFILDYLTKNN